MQHLRDILGLPVCAETKHSTFRAIVVAIMIHFGIQLLRRYGLITLKMFEEDTWSLWTSIPARKSACFSRVISDVPIALQVLLFTSTAYSSYPAL